MFKWSQCDLIAIPITILIIVVVAVACYFIFKEKSDKLKNIPLHIISGSLILLEVIKQIYYISSGNYPANVIPVHFCSLIVVIIAFAQFAPRKIAKFLDVPSVIFSIILILLLLVHPSALLGKSSSGIFLSFPNFHAFVFHALVMAYPILKLTLLRFDLKIKQSIMSLICCIVFYASYAIPLAFHLNINYMNILNSYFQPLENLRLACGQVVYDIVLFLLGMGGSIMLFFVWYLIDKKTKKEKNYA